MRAPLFREHPVVAPAPPVPASPVVEPPDEHAASSALPTRAPQYRTSNLIDSCPADTAYRLGGYFGTSAEMWMGLQQDWDRRSARDSGIKRATAGIRPLKRSA
jgi:hypothetical protein